MAQASDVGKWFERGFPLRSESRLPIEEGLSDSEFLFVAQEQDAFSLTRLRSP
jgi:hypothetical protein